MKNRSKISFDSIKVNSRLRIATILHDGISIDLKSNLITKIKYNDIENDKSGTCEIPTWIAIQRGLME